MPLTRILAASTILLAAAASPAMAQGVVTQKNISLALAESIANGAMDKCKQMGFRISVVVDENEVDAAVTATHRAFNLDTSEVEAVVYGGTGR